VKRFPFEQLCFYFTPLKLQRSATLHRCEDLLAQFTVSDFVQRPTAAP